MDPTPAPPDQTNGSTTTSGNGPSNGRAFGSARPRSGSNTVHLMARHREIIRLTVLGWSPTRIASVMDITVAAVRAVLRAPLVQAELEKLQDEADRLTVNVPLRAQVEGELRGATIEALRLNRRIMRDPSTDARVRTGVAKHFMDRVLFDVDTDAGEKSTGYREILRRLDEVDKSLGKGVWRVASDPSTSPETLAGISGDVAGTSPPAVGDDAPHSSQNGTATQTQTPHQQEEDPLTEAIESRIGIPAV